MRKKDFLLNLLEFVASYDTIDFKLPFLYFCYIFINSDLGPLSAATRVYFFIFLKFICVLTLMSLVLYFVFMYHFCIIDSDASPAQIVFFSCQNRNEVGKQ